MPRFLRNLCHRPAIRFGMARDPRSRFRDPRFASFLADSNRTQINTDFISMVLRSRKLMRQLFFLLLIGGGAWLLLESARALTVF